MEYVDVSTKGIGLFAHRPHCLFPVCLGVVFANVSYIFFHSKWNTNENETNTKRIE